MKVSFKISFFYHNFMGGVFQEKFSFTSALPRYVR